MASRPVGNAHVPTRPLSLFAYTLLFGRRSRDSPCLVLTDWWAVGRLLRSSYLSRVSKEGLFLESGLLFVKGLPLRLMDISIEIPGFLPHSM